MTDVLVRSQYEECAYEWRMQIRESEKQTELRVIESNNLGAFYNYVNKRISYRSGNSALIDGVGNVIVNDVDKANLFNEYFASVGTVDNNVLPPSTNKMSKGKMLSNVEFNSDNVMLAMNQLKESKFV